MRWTLGSRSNNPEGRGVPVGIGRALGIGAAAIVVALTIIIGRNLFTRVGVEGSNAPAFGQDSIAPEPAVEFMVLLLADVQAVWARILPRYGATYRPARLTTFRNSVKSDCGPREPVLGSFYCPLDERIYLELGFYDELKNRFGAPGDFAQAYILAHEVGHHVQHVLGADARIRQAQQANPRQANELSVRLELQADCYAGVWAHATDQRHMMQPGDLEAALKAASAVGNDRIQERTTESVNVDLFTHGSAAQRSESFKRGLQSGEPGACGTL